MVLLYCPLSSNKKPAPEGPVFYCWKGATAPPNARTFPLSWSTLPLLPAPSASSTARTAAYLREIDTVEGVPHTGTISLTYNNGQLTMAYKNSLEQTIQTPAAGDCTTIDLNSLNLNIPCLMIGGHKYRMRLLYDPSVQGGHYWKLDLTSLQEVQ